MKLENQNYKKLINEIDESYLEGQRKVVKTIQTQLVNVYWVIGKHIVEFEQKGNDKAIYGSQLLNRLSKDLTIKHGKGFSKSNLIYIRLLYLKYPKSETLSHQLSWSHYFELLKIDNDLERSFYEKQSILDSWSVRELKRQKKTALFLRLAASTDKKGIINLAKQGRRVEEPTDVIREPYILDFLKIPEPFELSESELENRLISHLQKFLLELGKGFAFVGRQYRITLDNTHYRVDLVFYHRILKCFVLIDLKKNKASHRDVGQMNMYMGYFQNEENTEGDNPPIGIILAREKDELLIKYAMFNMTSQLFVAKYQTYLPSEEELRAKLEQILLMEEE